MKNKKVLVTGATGFLGRWILRYWHTTHPDVELWATSTKAPVQNLAANKFILVDLCDKKACDELVSFCNPLEVIHLAGLIGRVTFNELIQANVVGTNNLLNALANLENHEEIRIVQASSASVYGLVSDEELPIRESQPYRPMTSYAISKLAQDHLGFSKWRRNGLRVMSARIFNTLGPDQPNNLVPMTFIKQLLKIKAGVSDQLKVGNTSSRRDFVDVGDIVRAFDALMQHGQPGEVYNVGSGKDVSIQEIIQKLLIISGLNIPVETVAERVQATDVPCVRADISKIEEKVGWKPKITLDKSLETMWNQAE